MNRVEDPSRCTFESVIELSGMTNGPVRDSIRVDLRRCARLLGVVLFGLAVQTCVTRPSLRPVEGGAAVATGHAKLHLWDGRLLVVEGYRVVGDDVTGVGVAYDPDRVLVGQGSFTVPIRAIALVETSELIADPRMATLAVVTAASLVATAACIMNPKACFGSCPTFYVPGGGGWHLQAEGFSSSIARSLAAEDTDALVDARPVDGTIVVAMRNEALETHVVQGLRLLVVDGPADSTVLLTHDNRFAALGRTVPPRECAGSPDTCDLLSERDGREFKPQSDGHDLASRDELVLRFDAPGNREVGVVVMLRNSLMSTFVLYHLIALQGSHYGDFLAAIERRDLAVLAAVNGFERTLGPVEVAIRQRDEAWRAVGEIPYIGPIALGVRVVPARVEHADEAYEVRLRYARAHWRFEAVRAGSLMARDLVAREVAASVQVSGRFDARMVSDQMRGRGAGLVMQPGDEVRFRFMVPQSAGSQAYFLRSRGYYYEWMRREWLREENVPLASALLADPATALRTLAPQFRVVEPRMDAVFEASRYTRQTPPSSVAP